MSRIQSGGATRAPCCAVLGAHLIGPVGELDAIVAGAPEVVAAVVLVVPRAIGHEPLDAQPLAAGARGTGQHGRDSHQLWSLKWTEQPWRKPGEKGKRGRCPECFFKKWQERTDKAD
jgi:hypothetical protein